MPRSFLSVGDADWFRRNPARRWRVRDYEPGDMRTTPVIGGRPARVLVVFARRLMFALVVPAPYPEELADPWYLAPSGKAMRASDVVAVLAASDLGDDDDIGPVDVAVELLEATGPNRNAEFRAARAADPTRTLVESAVGLGDLCGYLWDVLPPDSRSFIATVGCTAAIYESLGGGTWSKDLDAPPPPIEDAPWAYARNHGDLAHALVRWSAEGRTIYRPTRELVRHLVHDEFEVDDATPVVAPFDVVVLDVTDAPLAFPLFKREDTAFVYARRVRVLADELFGHRLGADEESALRRVFLEAARADRALRLGDARLRAGDEAVAHYARLGRTARYRDSPPAPIADLRRSLDVLRASRAETAAGYARLRASMRELHDLYDAASVEAWQLALVSRDGSVAMLTPSVWPDAWSEWFDQAEGYATDEHPYAMDAVRLVAGFCYLLQARRSAGVTEPIVPPARKSAGAANPVVRGVDAAITLPRTARPRPALDGDGTAPVPHRDLVEDRIVRAGHTRTQRFGPGRALTKIVTIPARPDTKVWVRPDRKEGEARVVRARRAPQTPPGEDGER